jgi:hypothetical protein
VARKAKSMVGGLDEEKIALLLLLFCFCAGSYAEDKWTEQGIYLELSKENIKDICKGREIAKFPQHPFDDRSWVQIGIYIQKEGADENYNNCPRCSHKWWIGNPRPRTP